MIFHISISADDPKVTATMLAELWRGQAFPFPMVGKGSWVAHAGDDRRSTIEVYPRDMALYPTDRAGEERYEPVSRHGPFHATAAESKGGFAPFMPPSRLRSASKRSKRSAAAMAVTRRFATAGRGFGSSSSGSTTL